MRKTAYLLLIFLLIFLNTSVISSKEENKNSSISLPSYQQTEVVVKDKQTRELRAVLSVILQKISGQKLPTYKIIKYGEGDYSTFKDVSWISKAEIQEDQNQIKTLKSSTVIKNNEGLTLKTYEKFYDHEIKAIAWLEYDSSGKVIKQTSFPLKGPTCDNVTLKFFLKYYAAHYKDPKCKFFYLLTDEPKCYKTNFKFLEEDDLDFSFGRFKANKFKLTADMGILDDLLDRFVPHTYIWYTKDSSCTWLKYEGFESGYQSTNITAYLNEITPAF